MRKLFIGAFLLFTIICSAQTTEEEYNYVVNGYKVQVVEQGGNLKKGYTLKDMGEQKLNLSDGSRGVTFKELYRDTATKPCAIMAIFKKYNKDGELSYSEYYCIPIGEGNSLWDKTIAQLNSHYDDTKGRELYEVMLSAFMHFSSKLATK